MFQLQTVNELTCMAQGQSVLYSKKGAMIAYQGQFQFDKLLIGPGGNLASAVLGHLARRVTGENMELMKVSGQGTIYLAELAKHVSVITLQPGESLGIESENLLAFTENCDYGVRFIGVGVISQKGLFTSTITAKGPGAQVAILTDGNPLALKSPCVVDPDAVVCWTGPDPSFKLDVSWKTLIGQTSGESYMLEFRNPGQTVIVQPSERKSGVKVAVDDRSYTPSTQGSAYRNTQQNMNNLMQNLTGGSHTPGRSSTQGGNLGGVLGSILNGRAF